MEQTDLTNQREKIGCSAIFKIFVKTYKDI